MGLLFIACAVFGACAQAAISPTAPVAMATAAPVATTPAPAATPAGMIACYNGPVAPSNTAYSMLFPALQDGAPIVCASYQYKCSKGDTSCTAAEAAQGTSKYAYIWTLASTCSTMETMEDVYSDVLCCSGDLCNAPDATLDPTTKVSNSSQPDAWCQCNGLFVN